MVVAIFEGINQCHMDGVPDPKPGDDVICSSNCQPCIYLPLLMLPCSEHEGDCIDTQ